MNEIELIIRIMLSNAYYYGSTTMLEFSEKHINEVVPKFNELFCKYGYKTDVFSRSEKDLTYKKYKKLMLSIFGDTIYNDDRSFDKNWFGLYDDELECLDMIHLSRGIAKKWLSF